MIRRVSFTRYMVGPTDGFESSASELRIGGPRCYSKRRCGIRTTVPVGGLGFLSRALVMPVAGWRSPPRWEPSSRHAASQYGLGRLRVAFLEEIGYSLAYLPTPDYGRENGYAGNRPAPSTAYEAHTLGRRLRRTRNGEFERRR